MDAYAIGQSKLYIKKFPKKLRKGRLSKICQKTRIKDVPDFIQEYKQLVFLKITSFSFLAQRNQEVLCELLPLLRFWPCITIIMNFPCLY